MTIKCKLSDEEENVIKIMWDINKRITPTQLIDEVEKRYHKKWAKQTITTILNRMMKKGGVTAYKAGRHRYYNAISIMEYNEIIAKEILDTMYNGSIKNFFVALYQDNKNIDKSDLEELKEWFSNE